ncbi:MAG: hypothetical protein WC911_01770 [Thermoleophilia bacterium]
MKSITIDGVEYAPVVPNGKRAIVVVDRGWIFAGDVTEANGRIILSRAVWVFKWTGGCGFSAIFEDAKKADVRKMPTVVDIPAKSEIYRVPVSDNWGL